MKNLILKSGVIATVAGVVLAPALSFAQFSTTTAITTVTNAVTDTGTIIAGVVGVIIGLMVALIGLGWGVRKIQKHVTGRKF